MARYTNKSIVPAALRGETVETANGNMSTVNVAGRTHYGYWKGNMPKSWDALYSERVREGHVTQVIFSYATPIAWRDSEHGWIVPVVRYSATTSSKHQTHLYRLKGRQLYLPYDATAEDAQRVLDGRMIFNGDRGTLPGPNYVAGE